MKPYAKTHASRAGFTLIEMAATVALVSLLASLAAPSLMGSLEKSRGKRCGVNLLLIEGAKVSFFLDHPWDTLTTPDQLAPYLPEGLPQCPAGGVYKNLTERFQRCECSANGQRGDSLADGLHDATF